MSEEILECRICGLRSKQLSKHITYIHKITCNEYKQKFSGSRVCIHSENTKRKIGQTGKGKHLKENNYQWVKRQQIYCLNCNKEVEVKDTEKGRKIRFCSIICYHTYRKNHMNEYPVGSKDKPYKCKDPIARAKKISDTMKSKGYKGKTLQERYNLTDEEYIELKAKQRHSAEENLIKNVLSEKTAKNWDKHYKKGLYISTKTGVVEKYDSGLELKRMKELDEDCTVKFWTKRHKIVIPYINFNNNEKHNYHPDFLIEYADGNKIIEETKGKFEDNDMFKLYALGHYCLTN